MTGYSRKLMGVASVVMVALLIGGIDLLKTKQRKWYRRPVAEKVPYAAKTA